MKSWTGPWQAIVPGHIAGGVLTALLVLAANEVIIDLMQSNRLQGQRTEVVNQLATLRARLEGEINSTLHLTRGLIAYVAVNPEVDDREFDALASEIVSVGRHIRNIGLARNNVITHIFPLAGNEAALGLVYEQTPEQWPAIRQAIERGGTTVAGPVALVQGGQAFIARTPIYTRSGLGGHLALDKPDYWGIASIVIDIPGLFNAVGLAPEKEGIQFALRGKDGMGEQGAMILGEPGLFDADPVKQTVLLPNGLWQIGAQPIGGWQLNVGEFWLIRLAGWLAALFLAFLIGALLRARAVNKGLALHDHLTGLPNRRLLTDRFEYLIARRQRLGGGFAVCYIDLDGFKGVNDRFGHRVGDGLLIEVAKRMRAGIRSTDTVARIGGDEFIVLADDIQEQRVLQQLCDQLASHLEGDVYIDGHRLALDASIGAALYPLEGEDIDQLLKAADHKMYRMKHGGEVYRVNFRG